MVVSLEVVTALNKNEEIIFNLRNFHGITDEDNNFENNIIILI